MIHILFEGMTSGLGGKESYIINTYNALDKNKYKSFFIAYDSEIAYEKYLKASGATIIHLPSRSENFFAYLASLKRIFENHDFDVIWSHKTTLSSCEALAIAKKRKVPIRMIHSHSSANMGNFLTYILHYINKGLIKYWATNFLACSDLASKWFYGNRPSLILKNAIDLESFRFNPHLREKLRKQYKLGNKKVIGHVGRFAKEKNHKKLLQVFKALHKMDKNTQLILCGDGQEREKISSLIHQLDLTDSVSLLGAIDNVGEVMQLMDLFVMPSFFEGLPFTLIEAQASGLKCVVSDTISPESDILQWNEFLPLSMSDGDWARAIMAMDLSYNREEGYRLLKEKGYDIGENMDIVEKIIEKEISSSK